jgi:glycosyltransferase involved in cell wall biosynthesis
MSKVNVKKDYNKKIIIIGGFPSQNLIGGAVVKNQIMYNYLKQYFKTQDINIKKLNTSYWRNKPISTFFNIIKEILSPGSFLFVSLSVSGALMCLSIIIPLSKLFKHDVRYLVIGGSLPELIRNRSNVIKRLKKTNGIYVETEKMREAMNRIGLNNVFYLPNFRYYEYIPSLNKAIHAPYKLVFFSRVTKDKGIELAIEAIRFINEEFRSIKFTLDIYGPVEEDCKELIENIGVQEIKEYITYKGVLNPNNDKLYETLSQYDVMIFPTYWHGEGFPGAIIDAYISGLPVIASDWKYNSEIVINEVTGKLFTAKNKQSLVSVLEWFLRNPGTIVDMSKNCIEEAKKYHVDNVLPQLIQDLGI